jgi:hypothetical protein
MVVDIARWSLMSLGSCFFNTNLYLGSIRVLKGRGSLGKAAPTKTSSSHARGVVWAVGECFLYFFKIILMFYGIYRLLSPFFTFLLQ